MAGGAASRSNVITVRNNLFIGQSRYRPSLEVADAVSPENTPPAGPDFAAFYFNILA
jgi:hypothetical protein